jgi:HSP20 family protein
MFDIIPNKRARDLFDLNFLSDFFTPNQNIGLNLDIKETPASYEFIVEVPGIKKEDIKIEMNHDVFTLSVQKHDEIQEENNLCIHKERHFGSMTRSFRIPGIDQDGINAKYQDGILHISLPKIDEERPITKTIPIE